MPRIAESPQISHEATQLLFLLQVLASLIRIGNF